jgi:hypothetical protein
VTGPRLTEDRATGNRGTDNDGTDRKALPGSAVPKGTAGAVQAVAKGATPCLVRERSLTPAQKGQIDFAEMYRKLALRAATRTLVDFAERVTMGDPSVSSKDPWKSGQLSAKDAHTVRGLRDVGLYPRSFDWLNDPSAKLMLKTVQMVITLFIQNAQHTEAHVFCPEQPPNDPTRAAQATSPMTIFPPFFKEWNDPLGPVLAITHEYFHYLFVPGTRQRIQHGLSHQRSEVDSSLADAYRLAPLAMWLAFGRSVEGI